MLNKNLILLSLAQIFSFTAVAITVFLSGIIGTRMTDVQSLATLPVALMIVGTAVGSIIASFVMSLVGRKKGFMFASFIVSLSALIASHAVMNNYFILYCLTNLFIGIGHAFTGQYRFAAAENVSKKYIPNAISLILFSSMIGALLGPNLATFSKDFIPYSTFTGSYIMLSLLTFIPFFIFIFYSDVKKLKKEKVGHQITRSYLVIISQPKFIQAVVAAAMGYCVMSFLMTATPISMHVHNNISVANTGVVIISHIFGMFMPSLITGSLVTKYGHNKIMYLGIFMLFLSIICNFLYQSFYNYLVGLILLGVGWNFLFTSGSSLLILTYHPDERFKAQGMNDFLVNSVQAIGALSAGLLLSLFGWQIINIICVPLLILVALTVYFVEKIDKSSTIT